MKLQNPPQAHFERAQSIEKFLAPPMIAGIYAIIAVFWAVLVSGLFASLVSISAVNPTRGAVTILVVLALIPSALGIIAYFFRPNDPASLYISRLAEMWRRPVTVTAERCMFKTILMNGDLLAIQIAVYYPSKDESTNLKEQIYTFAHAALSTLCSMRHFPPSKQDLEAAMEPALELVASEFKLSVLYADVLEAYVIEEAYTYDESVPALRTGTHG